MRWTEFGLETTGRAKDTPTPSRRVRRLVVLGLYLSFPLWGWLTHNSNHGGALPEGFGWYIRLEPWLAFGFFALFAFCAVKLARSNVNGLFSGPRDERQQAALMHTYSLSYTVLSAVIIVIGSVLFVLSLFFGDPLLPTSGDWMLLVSGLLLITGTLPKAVAMWLEPDPVPETERGLREA